MGLTLHKLLLETFAARPFSGKEPKYKDSHAVFCPFCLGQQMTKDSVCAVLREANIKPPDWQNIAKSLRLDSILSGIFFSQWSAFAYDVHPSWKALAKALENMNGEKYKQAAKKASQAEGTYVLFP